MSLSYFNLMKPSKKGKEKTHQTAASPLLNVDQTPKSPVLDEEDEKFLERLASIAAGPDATPPPLPERRTVILNNGEELKGKDAQEALMDGAEKVPLPMSPSEVIIEAKGEKSGDDTTGENKEKRKSFMSYFNMTQARFTKSKDQAMEKVKEKQDKKHEKQSAKDKDNASKSLHDAAEATKSAQQQEAEKEENDLTQILDDLNLSAVNNRVFSFSTESQELLDKFKLVLKDIVNGVPTAYNDLEKLLTDSEGQLKKMYGNLPPFLQNLVKSLPAKMTAALGPELLAAQAEKPGFDLKQKGVASASGTASGEGKKKSKRSKIPSLKQLVSAEGAVATMLKSILNFLKLRFPAFVTGTNVLMSLAVFLLLFVFWYCHKRGKETRLERERVESESALESSASVSSYSPSIASHKDDGGDGEKQSPPLIIHDEKESTEEFKVAVNNLPDVAHLPDPSSLKSDGTAPLDNPRS
ncbi:hypothetical protein GQ43DRAFT_437411 [Delitschia confertaspora ATCC 74209]|uniref:Ring-like domain-containing protein n=1 Tax=Delitschia confertaspora ATCC 74209 TaxID=1513339 RepID=A0A9P4MVR5_9PLEO|nr:hypothetical protein GQ43DRAFT_437411 [Delitschia confertaspora ATCC 74209]